MAGPIPVTLTSVPAVGNTLIAIVGTNDPTGTGVTGITQAGATWTLVKKETADRTVEQWKAPVDGVLSTSISISLGAGTFHGAAVVVEVANILFGSPADQTSGSKGKSNYPNTGVTPATTKAVELWLGGLLTERSVSVADPTNDFTIETQVNTGFGGVNTALLSKFVETIGTASVETYAGAPFLVEWAGVMATYFGPDTYTKTVGLDVAIRQDLDLDVAAAFGPVLLEMGMDMWIADGGAASQLFYLDTNVSVPLILGDHIVNDPGADIPYSIANLDTDVVSIGLGPDALGVFLVDSFINNGDGTGSFRATFDPSVPARQLTIIAVDDVDNESPESPIFIVNSFEQVQLSEDLTIVPKEVVSTSTCNRLLDGVPTSSFTLRRQYTLPYSYNKTSFEVRAITPNAAVTVTVLRRGLAGETDETQQYVLIPDQQVSIVNVRLGRGVNVISAIDQFGRSDTIIVAATTYAAILCSYAREIFNYSQVIIEEQEAAIFSPVSTRLAEPLLTFADLLPDVKAQQTLATKLAIRSLVSGAGREIGVRDLLTALTLSTPIFVQQNPDNLLFEPTTRPLYNVQEAFGGVEAHVWPANECVRSWLAFINFLSSSDVFQVVSISENEVVFYDDNGDLRRHVFDFAADQCSLTNLVQQQLCFEAVTVLVSIFSESDLVICAASYPLDMRPVPSHPMNQVLGEVENYGGLDPGFDGYVDYSVTDHWDGGNPLDSRGPMPAAGSGIPTCVYEDGYLFSPLGLLSTDIQIDEFIHASGTISVQPAVAVDLEVSLDLADVRIETPMDVSIGLPQLELGVDMVIEATVVLELGLSIAITNPHTVTAGMNVSIS